MMNIIVCCFFFFFFFFVVVFFFLLGPKLKSRACQLKSPPKELQFTFYRILLTGDLLHVYFSAQNEDAGWNEVKMKYMFVYDTNV